MSDVDKLVKAINGHQKELGAVRDQLERIANLLEADVPPAAAAIVANAQASRVALESIFSALDDPA